MARQPISVWWSPAGKAHVGKCGRPALCGYALPRGASEWSLDGDKDAALAALCGRCLIPLRKTGPWTDRAGWVRPPEGVADNVYVGGYTEAYRLNELTWRRVVTLGNRRRLTRAAAVEVAFAAHAAKDDPSREHVFRAMGGDHLLGWASMVDQG